MNIVAIDGPAASGKSTVGHRTAQALDFLYFDTGIMYRAVTWAVLAHELSPEDGDAVGRMAETLHIDILPPTPDQGDGRQATVRVDDQDITWAIRTPEVDRNVSAVAANPRVRAALTSQQRRIGLQYGLGQGDKPGVVMVGRDIGTVVLPEAPVKIYLCAPVEERARRRFQELVERGKPADLAQVLADLQRRDQIDSQRAVAPLRPAEDAICIQTAGATVEEIVQQIVALARERLSFALGPTETGETGKHDRSQD